MPEVNRNSHAARMFVRPACLNYGRAMAKLHYREYGAGDPVVILHGLYGSSANWGSVARALAGRHRTILPDLRNHGDSPHRPAMSYEAMAGDVAELMDRLGLDVAALVGHSMGGKVVMTLALQRPRRVRRLCVVDIAPVPYPPHLSAILDALEGVDLARTHSRPEADRQLAGWIDSPMIRAFLLQSLSCRGGRCRWRMNLPALRAGFGQLIDFPAPAGPYAGPALFLAGARSDYISDETLPAIHARFPAAIVKRVVGAGHWVHVDAPEVTVDLLRAFLSVP